MTTRFVHASGRFNANGKRFAAYLADLIELHGARVLTATECQGRGIARELRRLLGKGWTVEQRGEFIIAHSAKNRRPATLQSLTGRHWRDMRVMFKHVTINGRKVRLMVTHAPAGVEYGDGWRTGNKLNRQQVSRSKRGFAQWGAMVRRQWRRFGVVQIANGDFNLNQLIKAWREWCTSELGAPSVFAVHRAKRGTHGPRLIDTGHVLGADVLDAGVSPLNPPKDADHRAIWFEVDL